MTDAEIVAIYRQPGMSIEKTARMVGLGCIRVRAILTDAGVTLRTAGNQPGTPRHMKPCQGTTWAGLDDKADIPAEMFEIRETYRR